MCAFKSFVRPNVRTLALVRPESALIALIAVDCFDPFFLDLFPGVSGVSGNGRPDAGGHVPFRRADRPLKSP